MTVVQMPDRSERQRMDALAKANMVRTHRRKLKEGIREGRINPALIVGRPYDLVESMRLEDVLLSVPRVGTSKARKVMNGTGCAPSKTIGGLSPRQRREVCEWLEQRWSTLREQRKAAA